MASKNVTIRLSDDERAFFERVQEEKGLNRTDLVRSAVKHFAYCDKGSTAMAKEIVQKTIAKPSRDVSHPLLTKIEDKGLVIHNEDGSVLREIKNLSQLLDFVNTKVLRNEI